MTNHLKVDTNLFWPDFVRASVMLLVVMVHVTSDIITEWGKVPNNWWWWANFYDSIARGCVPLFIMLSGAFLLGKTETYLEFFRKRFAKVVIPAIVWTALYLIWKKQFYKPNLDLISAFQLVASGNVWFHLWFIYLIVGLYLITPVFRILIAHASKQDLIYFLVLWFVLSSLFPFSEKCVDVFTNTSYHIQIPVEPAQGFIGYFVLGYFLKQFVSEKWLPAAWLVFILSFLICFFGTYFVTARFNSFQMLFYENLYPNVVFYSVAYFIIVQHSKIEKRISVNVQKSIRLISEASLGIYLIHPMILDTLTFGRLGVTLRADLFSPFYGIPFVTLIVYVLSFLAVWMVQKIPFLRRIV